MVEPDLTLEPVDRLRAALKRVANPEFLTTEYLSLRLQLWALASAHDDFEQINTTAQTRYRAGLSALILTARPQPDARRVQQAGSRHRRRAERLVADRAAGARPQVDQQEHRSLRRDRTRRLKAGLGIERTSRRGLNAAAARPLLTDRLGQAEAVLLGGESPGAYARPATPGQGLEASSSRAESRMTIQQPTELTHAAMLGLGVHRPERVVTNDEICEVLDSSDEWIQTRSGIRTRRFAGADETLIGDGDRGGRAGARGRRGEPPSRSAASSSRPRRTPSTRRPRRRRSRPRSASTAAAFDISAGCAGFCHALNLASSMVRAGAETHVLVIGVEQLSRFMDPTDRGTAFIFADGAGAVVVGPADATGIGPTAWGSDGSQAHVITQTPSCLGGHQRADHPVVQMEGTAVFRWAPFAMAEVAHEALRLPGSPSTTSTPSSRTRPTCASPRPWPGTSSSPSPSRSPPTSSTPATPRPPRCRSRWRRCCATARRRPATPRC